jgi:5-methylcytosine-specific restriction endonuclease McrA
MSRKGIPNKISKKIEYTCLFCGKVWLDYPSRKTRKKYCSFKCSKFSIDRIEKLKKRSVGNKWGNLRIITDELRKKISNANRGKKRQKISENKMGEKNHNWKGGVTPINKKIRMSFEYREWRGKVFNRDNYTCQSCNKRGGELHPHHIKPFSIYPELRFNVSNGITLCRSCHIKTDTWGKNMKYPLPKEQK